MNRPAAIVLAAANDNARYDASRGASRFSPDFFALANRVLDGRTAWRRSGLSGRGVRIMQALGYLAPADLPPPVLGEVRETPPLLIRAAALKGCGPQTLNDLRLWLAGVW